MMKSPRREKRTVLEQGLQDEVIHEQLLTAEQSSSVWD